MSQKLPPRAHLGQLKHQAKRAAWTAEQRRAQAAVLRAALAEELTAVAALERALEELGMQGAEGAAS